VLAIAVEADDGDIGAIVVVDERDALAVVRPDGQRAFGLRADRTRIAGHSVDEEVGDAVGVKDVLPVGRPADVDALRDARVDHARLTATEPFADQQVRA